MNFMTKVSQGLRLHLRKLVYMSHAPGVYSKSCFGSRFPEACSSVIKIVPLLIIVLSIVYLEMYHKQIFFVNSYYKVSLMLTKLYQVINRPFLTKVRMDYNELFSKWFANKSTKRMSAIRAFLSMVHSPRSVRCESNQLHRLKDSLVSNTTEFT